MSKPEYFIAKGAVVDNGAKIGRGTKVWHFSHIMAGSQIGKNCTIGQNVFIADNTKIGSNVKIQNNVSIYSGITLEDGVFCGPSAVFTNVKNPRSLYPVNKHYKKTLIRKGATIGANATIVCGIIIGRHAFIGAGSVATKDVPDFALLYGNPAKLQGWMCECGKKLTKTAQTNYICQKCKRKYILVKSRLTEK
ncbi:MAG: N-acetyltransferase [Candidatus Omnitrophica bacterium]|nr:N-acetyltransferase [Candidatus Omnitrophota bacterium]